MTDKLRELKKRMDDARYALANCPKHDRDRDAHEHAWLMCRGDYFEELSEFNGKALEQAVDPDDCQVFQYGEHLHYNISRVVKCDEAPELAAYLNAREDLPLTIEIPVDSLLSNRALGIEPQYATLADVEKLKEQLGDRTLEPTEEKNG